jgi:hypothetical protein
MEALYLDLLCFEQDTFFKRNNRATVPILEYSRINFVLSSHVIFGIFTFSLELGPLRKFKLYVQLYTDS